MFGLGGNDHADQGAHVGCEFGLCRREAELEVSVAADVVPLLVCGLHVTPVLTWGVPDPATDPVIRVLAHRHGEAA